MRKDFRLAGLAAAGLWISVGCGFAFAETAEVRDREEPRRESLIEVPTFLPDEISEPVEVRSVSENDRVYEPDDKVYEPDTVSVVPEPGAWAMMIAGFAFLGLFSRHRAARRRMASGR